MAVKLEAGDFAQAAAVAEQLVPHGFPSRSAALPTGPTTAELARIRAPQRCRLGSAARGADLPARAPT
jgi:hypothetical protein